MGMTKVKWGAVLGLALGLQATPSVAGIYADDLTRCLVEATTTEDRMTMTRWMFAAMSAHPSVADMSNVTADDRVKANRDAALLIERLILTDCRTKAVAAIRYEGGAVLQGAFETVGRVAMGDIMGHPKVAAQLESLNGYMNQQRLEEFTAEVTRLGAPAPQS